jgi:hydroxymethylpyrimidine/phosphomethylpyrimidine kinase
VKGRVLIVAGSDSGGGAGIQADIKTITALGAYAASAVTALTAQNTEGVFAIHGIPPEFIARQMHVVLSDIGADVIKIGMLHSSPIIEAVAGVLEGEARDIPLVLDPVMLAKGGAPLLAAEAMDSLKEHVVPRAALLTPNIPEAETLAGRRAPALEEAEDLARALLALGPRAVLLKGGHREGDVVSDLLMEEGGARERFESPRLDTRHTHGTGCTLASAIAAGLAQGLALPAAVGRARAYVTEAIRTAPGLGAGHGPLNHAHTVRAWRP